MKNVYFLIALLLLSCKTLDYTKNFSIHGIYKNREKGYNYKLTLKKDSTFVFNKTGAYHSLEFSHGFWNIEDDILYLSTRELKGEKDVSLILTNGLWLEFKNLAFRVKRNSLTPISNNIPKLKKE